MKSSLVPLIGLLCACAVVFPGGSPAARDSCVQPGAWIDPASGTPLDFRVLLDRWVNRSVILLGESHTSVEDHAWQLQLLAALHGRTPNLVIGFEAFPRRLQPVLDRWVAGDLSRQQFLKESEWNQVWGFPSMLYQPLFDFARMNRIPMVALNVERKLVKRIGQEGWAAIPPQEREGLDDPVPATGEYVTALASIYAQHGRTDNDSGENDNTQPDPADPDFRRFVEAQLTWDRAMAEALATASSRHPGHVVVGILGRGHVEYGYGVPHQLADLGIDDATPLVTWTTDRDCAELRAASGVPVAEAVFAIHEEQSDAEPDAPRGPKLGIMLSDSENGVRIDHVVDDSVAADTGLKTGDVITEAAGLSVAVAGDLVTIIRRQPYGTWLPLVVRRDGTVIDLVAKFPARPHPPLPGPSPHHRGNEPGSEDGNTRK